jgi:hypothetical protein
LQKAHFHAKCAQTFVVQLAIEKELSVDNNEYKIITSNTPLFHNSARLKQVLAEEAPAGWDLHRLIDPYKVMVSRDKSHRSGDSTRSLDPYRIKVGMNQAVYLGIAAVITIIVIWAIIEAAAMSVV